MLQNEAITKLLFLVVILESPVILEKNDKIINNFTRGFKSK